MTRYRIFLMLFAGMLSGLPLIGQTAQNPLPASDLKDPQGKQVLFRFQTLPTSAQIYTCRPVEYPGLAHEWQNWRKQLNDFAPMLFQRKANAEAIPTRGPAMQPAPRKLPLEATLNIVSCGCAESRARFSPLDPERPLTWETWMLNNGCKIMVCLAYWVGRTFNAQ
jgi:hypothetical protein